MSCTNLKVLHCFSLFRLTHVTSCFVEMMSSLLTPEWAMRGLLLLKSPPAPTRNNIEHPRTCGTIYRQHWVTECYGSPRWSDYLQHTLYEVNWAGRRHYIILGGLMSLPASMNIWRVIKKTEPGWRLTLCFHKRLICILFSNNFFLWQGSQWQSRNCSTCRVIVLLVKMPHEAAGFSLGTCVCRPRVQRMLLVREPMKMVHFTNQK